FKVGTKGSLNKPAPLAESKFYKGSAAHDADDRIIYDAGKGILWYDDDGIGGHKAVKITTMPKKLALKASDFFVI
ncbi:MAG: calcium-binding protein, partial [Microvirga sp.]